MAGARTGTNIEVHAVGTKGIETSWKLESQLSAAIEVRNLTLGGAGQLAYDVLKTRASRLGEYKIVRTGCVVL